jgi:hypothetical protein
MNEDRDDEELAGARVPNVIGRWLLKRILFPGRESNVVSGCSRDESFKASAVPEFRRVETSIIGIEIPAASAFIMNSSNVARRTLFARRLLRRPGRRR